jgi:hypothetical protein
MCVSICGLVMQSLPAQDLERSVNDIGQALLKGDSKALAAMFMETIELDISSHKGKFSRNQAQMILRDWFLVNEPLSYELRQEGKTGNSVFLIGFLNCKTETFRVYIMFDGQSKQTAIHYLSLTKNER